MTLLRVCMHVFGALGLEHHAHAPCVHNHHLSPGSSCPSVRPDPPRPFPYVDMRVDSSAAGFLTPANTDVSDQDMEMWPCVPQRWVAAPNLTEQPYRTCSRNAPALLVL